MREFVATIAHRNERIRVFFSDFLRIADVMNLGGEIATELAETGSAAKGNLTLLLPLWGA